MTAAMIDDRTSDLERGEQLATAALDYAMKLVQQLRPDVDEATVDGLLINLYGLADAIAEYPESSSAMAGVLEAALRAIAFGNTPGTCWCELSESGVVSFICQTPPGGFR